MKLDKDIIAICYHNAAILQTKRNLKKDGFLVKDEKNINGGSLHFAADLYAEKDTDKRLYEFKIIGNKKAQEGHLKKFKDVAESIGAKPIVIYINPPVEKTIEFDDLGDEIFGHILSEGVPQSVDQLSTHSSIESVEIDTILSCAIGNDNIMVSGYATVDVNLQWGSSSDLKHDVGAELSTSFPMDFQVTVNLDLKIENISYSIDTSEWYEYE